MARYKGEAHVEEEVRVDNIDHLHCPPSRLIGKCDVKGNQEGFEHDEQEAH